MNGLACILVFRAGWDLLGIGLYCDQNFIYCGSLPTIMLFIIDSDSIFVLILSFRVAEQLLG
jgi:hypothetical protein